MTKKPTEKEQLLSNLHERCGVRKPLFPAMKNPIYISDELAEEYLEWVREQVLCLRNEDVVNRLAARIEKQLNRS